MTISLSCAKKKVEHGRPTLKPIHFSRRARDGSPPSAGWLAGAEYTCVVCE